MKNKKNFADLELAICYEFSDYSLLKTALTHRSYGPVHNERLEFLGDSVLNLAITFFLYSMKEKFSEGELHKLKSNLVCEKTLSRIAMDISLFNYLFISDGELRNGGNMRVSILADSLEAVFGAVLIDSSYAQTVKVINFIYGPTLKNIKLDSFNKDPKSELQEILQGKKLPVPQYEVVSKSGADHDQIFRVKCHIPKLNISSFGHGSNRKAAETESAQMVIDQVKFKLKITKYW